MKAPRGGCRRRRRRRRSIMKSRFQCVHRRRPQSARAREIAAAHFLVLLRGKKNKKLLHLSLSSSRFFPSRRPSFTLAVALLPSGARALVRTDGAHQQKAIPLVRAVVPARFLHLDDVGRFHGRAPARKLRPPTTSGARANSATQGIKARQCR